MVKIYPKQVKKKLFRHLICPQITVFILFATGNCGSNTGFKWIKPGSVFSVELNLNPYIAGIDFIRQNLTSADVRF